MGDMIKALSDSMDKHGPAMTIAIVFIVLVMALMGIHLMMLKSWAKSNERLAQASEARVALVERRNDAMLVGNMNLQKALIEVNGSQDMRLSQLVEATENAAENVAEQALAFSAQGVTLEKIEDNSKKAVELSQKLNDLLGSDPNKLCRYYNTLKYRFPSMTDDEIEKAITMYMDYKDSKENKEKKEQKS